jgi:hypothetical protein
MTGLASKAIERSKVAGHGFSISSTSSRCDTSLPGDSLLSTVAILDVGSSGTSPSPTISLILVVGIASKDDLFQL